MKSWDALGYFVIILALLGSGCAFHDAVYVFGKVSKMSPELKGPQRGNLEAPSHRIQLNIPADCYFASPEGRGLLKYLVRCALDATTEADLTLPGERLTFVGGVGLAPQWAERPLTLTEQRWVSACIFALTNKLGKTVRVDLRGAHPKIGAATDTQEEKSGYPLHEGGFFGNMFLSAPVAYVCEGADREMLREFPIGKVRRCTQPSGKTTAGGQPLSECGFIMTGPCSSPPSMVVGGERIDEVIHTWLSPEPRE
jgi:hypothetical protein